MLVIGVPGLAKTMMVKALADLLGWEFRRIQFTPDLMPADITGTEILQSDESGQRRALIFIAAGLREPDSRRRDQPTRPRRRPRCSKRCRSWP
jgi:MoxR-like ATPase